MYATFIKTGAIGMYVILMKLITRKNNCTTRKNYFLKNKVIDLCIYTT